MFFWMTARCARSAAFTVASRSELLEGRCHGAFTCAARTSARADRLDRQILAAQISVDLHEATGIGGNDVLRAGLLDRVDFHFVHRVRNHREFHGKRAAEPATCFRLVHLDQFKAAHLAQKLARFVLESQFAQRMAGVMIGHVAGNFAPTSVTPSFFTRNSANSKVLAAACGRLPSSSG